ncbi:cytochrome c oxidase subunit 5A, mitochondrial-like [Ciona intestinalis]
MFRSVLRLAQVSTRFNQIVSTKVVPKQAVSFTPVSVKKYSSSAVAVTDEEHTAAWISFFERKDLDYVIFKIGFMNLYHEDSVPEPAIVQAALYACRRINNLPLAMRVYFPIQNKCDDRQDIYDYIIQELRPSLDDLGLKTVEEYGLDQVLD